MSLPQDDEYGSVPLQDVDPDPSSHVTRAYTTRPVPAPMYRSPYHDHSSQENHPLQQSHSSQRHQPANPPAALDNSQHRSYEYERNIPTIAHGSSHNIATPRLPIPQVSNLSQYDGRGRDHTLNEPGLHSNRQQQSRSRTSSSIHQSLPDEETCDCCDRTAADIFFCNVCNTNLCEKCWSFQAAHRKQRLAPGEIPHEKTNATVARKIQRVLVQPSNDENRTQLHGDDEQTAWFGIERPDGSAPIFQDYGRYASLLSETEEDWNSQFQTTQLGRDSRTPSLVSFVGQTGAGKSTLIKLIVDLNTENDQLYRTPVVGASGVNVPTSEDVHLYSDPVTALSETPVFFADCEGLQGGEREPLGVKFKRSRKKGPQKDERVPLPSSERELVWADTTALASREFAVTNLYPRLLYTFSDVIVFVLRNPRVIESVFEQLVNWAAAALEMSSNQPVLPHAIIVLNASENDIDPQQWDPNFATEALLESISRTVFRNSTFKKYAQFWRERRKEIESVKQLMESYYSSIQVVRIPAEGRPQLIEEQVKQLYVGIHTACVASRTRKAQLRMLLDAEELQSYLQCAFDHFALTLDSPFDFVQASFSNSPIPLDFGGNILKLAINFMHVWENKADIRIIFQELSYMVASCIMLDSVRNKNKGTANVIFLQYLPHLDAALENFWDQHWPCEFTQPERNLRCVNVRSGHGSKGHQIKDGKVFAVGEYQSRWSFDLLQEEFRCNSYYRLEELLQLLDEKKAYGNDERRTAAEIHRDYVMPWFNRHASGDGKSQRYHSHTVCFCCLSEPPEYALPCGHILCLQCVRTYGENRGKTEIEMQGCPLEFQTTQLYHSWRIYFKPKSAGVRVLTLDGGGMRGIVELEILRSIERELNDKLAIHYFFDLIVGTSTGGIIALGLVARNWSVQTCIDSFEVLCSKAFTRRIGGDLPVFSWVVTNYMHSKYETKSLHDALIDAFSEDEYLFGGRKAQQSPLPNIKVAVTSTVSSNSAIVFGNYNRRCDEKLPYQFHRAEDIHSELRIWEAARATSAAPRPFKPFHHEPSKQVYMDGALCHNNPIKVADREWKLLWPDGLREYPDIVLSLGTGYNPHAVRVPVKKSVPERVGILSHGMSLLKLAKDHIADSLNCEKAWGEYISLLPSNASSSQFIRFNIPMMNDPPALDDVSKMKTMQDDVRKQLSRDSNRTKKLALQLLATSFYWETLDVQQFTNNEATVSGRILCRFTEGSRETKELGKLIKDKSFVGKNPFFFISERGSKGNPEIKELSPGVLSKMIYDGRFEMRTSQHLENKLSETDIYLYINQNQEFPISGFPRCLFQGEDEQARTMHPMAINRRRWAGGSRNRHMRGVWVPPDAARLSAPREGSIAEYSDPSRSMTLSTGNEVNAPRFSELPGDERLHDETVLVPQGEPVEIDSSTSHELYSFPLTPRLRPLSTAGIHEDEDRTM
ncbi:unnamed protein product [Periconia digitata]|uniref:FabD/lysophospholipase-like protein n=1 Tax=Periconia digitata TaxID=1303443 RepID=A0A9W4U3Y4_9PLEO|nr:unnamed protein product [Periconia digitata]